MVVESLAQDIAVSHVENILEADQLLREIAGANRQPTYAETVFFTRECGWSDVTIREQLRRMVNVLRLQSISGTTADREAASKEAETATSVCKKESPKIIDQIEKLQSKLNQLERDERLATKRRDEQVEAVGQLRSMTPEHVAKSVNERRSLLNNTLRRQISDIETRTQELECCLNPSKYRTEQDYFDTVQRCRHDAVLVSDDRNVRRKQLCPATWPTIRAELEAELSALREQIDPLQSQYDSEMAKIEADLNYYAR